MVVPSAPAIRRRLDVPLAALALVVAVLALGCGVRTPAASGAVPVMPLGDSITDGFNVPGGYRIELEDRLIRAGTPADFVGSMANGPGSLADRRHEGHSGWRIDQIARVTRARLARYKPRVVLLLIGTNDVVQDHDLRTAPERLSALVDQIVAGAPAATVLVASLPPLADATLERRVRAYNAAIPGIVREKAREGARVRLVDMHRRLTPAHLADGVHPTVAGYRRMAAVWDAALRPVLRGSVRR